MAGVPVKHHTHGKVGRRRSHLALKKARLAVCANCGGPKRPHVTCVQCGGRENKVLHASVAKPVKTKAQEAAQEMPEGAEKIAESEPAQEVVETQPEQQKGEE